MNLELYQLVTLRTDLPEYHLTMGQQVILIDYVSHPQGGEAGCIVEAFDESGESIAVVAVPQSSLEPTATSTPPSRTALLESFGPGQDRHRISPEKPLRMSKPALPKRSPLEVDSMEVPISAEEIVACVREGRER